MVVPGLPLAEHAVNVLDHDHGRVDEDAEVHSAERQQIHRHVACVEQHECGRERERDRRRDDEARAQARRNRIRISVTSMHAEQEIVLDGVRRQVDEIRAVVVRMDWTSFGRT